jgi:branched-chain amino acid transport system substrate-binding protein
MRSEDRQKNGGRTAGTINPRETTMDRRHLITGAGALAAAALPTRFAIGQASELKIGFVTTMTTPSGVMGRDMSDALAIAIEHAGGSIAGRRINLMVEDDGQRPETGKQKAEKLINQDKVDFIGGFVWSNVLLASRKPIVDSGTFLISTNAGPSDMAGRLCHPNVFFTRGQNDMVPMALGETLNKRGVKKLYAMAPNYAAGKDMVAGVKRTFKGALAGEDLTKWGDDPQLDFSAELAKVKASGADAVFAFYPGRASAAFVKQFEQSGLGSGVRLFSVYTIDGLSLPPLQAAGLNGVLGSETADYWAPNLDNPVNRRFVEDFLRKHNRYPSNYAAAAYDMIPMIKAAAEAAGGDMSKKDVIRAALRKGGFASVRGGFSLGANHFPLDNYYAVRTVADAQGRWTQVITDQVMTGAADPYAGECKMPAA